MMKTRLISRRSLPFGLALVALLAISALPVAAAPATGSTLDNLQAAFDGESNASARYLAFSRKAAEEGYGQVSSLFKAAARAEEIHAANHAVVIKKLGGVPKADVKAPEVKTGGSKILPSGGAL